MLLNEIEQLTLKECEQHLIYRIFKDRGFELMPFSFNYDDKGNQSIAYEEGYEKPTNNELSAEFTEYKTELIIEENARLDEIERIEDINNRWSAMFDAVSAFRTIYKSTPNCELWKNEVLLKINAPEASALLQEIESADEELRTAHVDTEYQRNRAKEYPAIAEQLDMLYHDKKNNSDSWFDLITSIKSKYPKK